MLQNNFHQMLLNTKLFQAVHDYLHVCDKSIMAKHLPALTMRKKKCELFKTNATNISNNTFKPKKYEFTK